MFIYAESLTIPIDSQNHLLYIEQMKKMILASAILALTACGSKDTKTSANLDNGITSPFFALTKCDAENLGSSDQPNWNVFSSKTLLSDTISKGNKVSQSFPIENNTDRFGFSKSCFQFSAEPMAGAAWLISMTAKRFDSSIDSSLKCEEINSSAHVFEKIDRSFTGLGDLSYEYAITDSRIGKRAFVVTNPNSTAESATAAYAASVCAKYFK